MGVTILWKKHRPNTLRFVIEHAHAYHFPDSVSLTGLIFPRAIVVSMLAQRGRRWASIEAALA